MNKIDEIFESTEMRTLTKMAVIFMKEIHTEKMCNVEDLLKEEEKNTLPRLVEEGLVNKIEGKYYLSSRGQSLASMGLRRLFDLDAIR